jgi:hypothetical protein
MIGVAAIAAAALLLVACGDDDDSDAGLDLIDVRVTDSGIEPDNFRLFAPAEYRLAVRNDSDETCSFSLGTLVRDLEVAAGSSGSVRFSTVDTGSNDEVEVGCGDARNGTASIRQPGS